MPKPPKISEDPLTEADWELIMSVFKAELELEELNGRPQKIWRAIILLRKSRKPEGVGVDVDRTGWTAINKVFKDRNLPFFFTNTSWGVRRFYKKYRVFRTIKPVQLTQNEIGIVEEAFQIMDKIDIVNVSERGLLMRFRSYAATNENR